MMLKQEIKREGVLTRRQWFPLCVTSEQLSLNYMKRLTAVAVSHVLYSRHVFAEHCFGRRSLDELTVRLLTERCGCVSEQIIHWMKGCFDAIDRKCLKRMSLAIYSDPMATEDLIECYGFTFGYNSNQLNISLSKDMTERVVADETVDEDLRHSTVKLLRSLDVMIASLDSLPVQCFLTMKLLYYDDITPEDYEPMGFVRDDNHSMAFRGRAVSVCAGEVDTPFHTFQFNGRTNQLQFQEFDSTPDSDVEDMDECTPLAIEGTVRSDSAVEKSIECENKIKSKIFCEKSTKEVMNEWLSSSRERLKPLLVTYSRKDIQKKIQRNVISKMRRLILDDIEAFEGIGRFERVVVSEDSVFESVLNSQKKLKASNAFKTIPISRCVK